MDLATFISTWAKNDGGEERANKDTFLNQLCQVLDVPQPGGVSRRRGARR